MVSRGDEIEALDYNTLRSQVIQLLGTGSGTYGYGQALQSTSVVAGQNITAAQWNNLRYDIMSILIHQDGTSPSLPTIGTTTVIGAGAADPANYFGTVLNTATTNRFAVATGQYALSVIDTKTYTSSWNTSASATATLTFSNATDARYFFNSGGKIRISGTRSGGTSSQQNNAWTNLLSAAGDVDFGAEVHPAINYYNLTSSYQTYYQQSSTTPYSANNIRFEAKCDVANNSAGTARIIDIKVTLYDSYVDLGPPSPGDLVDGTLTLYFQELKASGSLQPSGTFSITSPSYSVTSITAS